jgi:hypothetical protein
VQSIKRVFDTVQRQQVQAAAGERQIDIRAGFEIALCARAVEHGFFNRRKSREHALYLRHRFFFQPVLHEDSSSSLNLATELHGSSQKEIRFLREIVPCSSV